MSSQSDAESILGRVEEVLNVPGWMCDDKGIMHYRVSVVCSWKQDDVDL